MIEFLNVLKIQRKSYAPNSMFGKHNFFMLSFYVIWKKHVKLHTNEKIYV